MDNIWDKEVERYLPLKTNGQGNQKEWKDNFR